MLQLMASLTDNSRGIIYDHNMFIVQATALTKAVSLLYYINYIFSTNDLIACKKTAWVVKFLLHLRRTFTTVTLITIRAQCY
jgi:hypothetical protein